MKRYSTASVLWFLLGGVGGHKFYLGRPALGALYLSAWPLVFSGLPYYAVMPPLWVAVILDKFTLRAQVDRANADAARRVEARERTRANWRDGDPDADDLAAVDHIIARYAKPTTAAAAQPDSTTRRAFGRRGV